MSPPEWHIKFAYEMLDMAEKSLAVQRYAIVATAVLKAFDEVIDAYTAKHSGLHFHNDYPNEASQERMLWVMTNKPELFEIWQQIIKYMDPDFRDGVKAQHMVCILKSALDSIEKQN